MEPALSWRLLSAIRWALTIYVHIMDTISAARKFRMYRKYRRRLRREQGKLARGKLEIKKLCAAYNTTTTTTTTSIPTDFLNQL